MNDHIEIRIGMVPGRMNDIVLNGDRTVQAGLTAAGLTVPSGYTIRVNGSDANTGTRLADGDTVLIVKNVKGN